MSAVYTLSTISSRQFLHTFLSPSFPSFQRVPRSWLSTTLMETIQSQALMESPFEQAIPREIPTTATILVRTTKQQFA
jgi:hypothetical protein